MLLLDRQGRKDDSFAQLENGEKIAGKAPLVPLAALEAELAAQGGAPLGVLVENNVRTAELESYFGKLALIAIRFPSATDGRGFSLARQLRDRGFIGVLRASGPLFPDQFPQALACGFDEVEIPDANAARQPVEQWLAARDRITLAYQHENGLGESILELRRARTLEKNLAGAKNV
jgi:uncharacterized protein (DUF934 family)